MAIRLGDGFAAATQAAAFGEPIALGGVTVTFHPAGHVLGSAQIAVAAPRPPHRRRRRLQAHARPDLRRLRAGPLRRLHHRGDLRPAGLPPPRRRWPRSPSCSHSLAQFPERTHLVGVYALGKAQRLIRLLRDAGYDAPDLPPRRAAPALRLLRRPRHRPRRPPRRHPRPRPRPRLRRPDRARAALGLRRPLGPPLRRPADRLRLRLDAGARPRPPARRRAAARRLRPLRLARAHRAPSPSSTRPRSGSPTAARRRWSAGARSQGRPARPLHLVGYEDEADD